MALVILALLLTVLWLTEPAAAKDGVVGRAVVTDGDTLRIGETRIRLFGIDAPEGRQTCVRDELAWLCGQESAKYLRETVAGQPLYCEEKNFDQYRRLVAQCRLPDGRDVGEKMVAAGMALAYRQYGGSTYDGAESLAKKLKRGLWSGTFQPGWVWRRDKRNAPQ